MEPLQSNWLFLITWEKQVFSYKFLFLQSSMKYKKKIKVCASVPGNCLVSTDVSIFDNFFKTNYWLMWKTTQKQIWCFCASAQYCHNTSLVTAHLIIKITMSTQEQELKKFLKMLAGMRPKFWKFSFTGESYLITQITLKWEKGRSAKEPGQE